MLLEKERQLVVDYCRTMSEKGLSTGTSGNISIRNREEGLIALSASGMDYFIQTAEDVVVLDNDGNIVEGIRKPSSEWRLHTDFYRNHDEAGAIVHTHSMYCTILGCLGMTLKPVHYVIAGACEEEIPLAPYRTYGTQELSDAVNEACGSAKGVLMANHGMLASGADIRKAYNLAANMEFCAELQYRCLTVGEPYVLNREQLDDVRRQFADYGQTRR